jgi:hypothetical protein
MARSYSKYNSARSKSLFNHSSRIGIAKLSFSGSVDANTTASDAWPDSGSGVTFASQVSYGDAAVWCSFSGISATLAPGTYRATVNMGVVAGSTSQDFDWAITDSANGVRIQSTFNVGSLVGDAIGDAGVVYGTGIFEVSPDDLIVKLHGRSDKASATYQGGNFSELWLEKVA